MSLAAPEPRNWYNENDPGAAAWLRELIAGGHIAPGIVDERDIRDVRPDEIRHFTQCHFFAGIGVWSYALRRAGWADDRPVWTGSCPCQPFSAAGRGGGFTDKRHLWPHWFHLVSQCRPSVILGEQTSSADGLAWFDLVQTDLENAGYACGAADTCAAGVGAPNIRQRLYFGAQDRLADTSGPGSQGHTGNGACGDEPGRVAAGACGSSAPGGFLCGEVTGTHATDGFWRKADWITCAEPDGVKWRPVQPGTFPLADGPAARVVRLRGYGNALNAQQATAFVEAFMGAAA